MARHDPDGFEIHARVVFTGPRGGGKTETLRAIRDELDPAGVGTLLAPSDSAGRTVLLDLLTVELGRLHGREVRLQLIAAAGGDVPEALRRRILAAADAVVFVADSAPGRLQANLLAYREFEADLRATGSAPPLFLQFNKRDLVDAIDREELTRCLDAGDRPVFETSALRREGVLAPLVEAAGQVVQAHA